MKKSKLFFAVLSATVVAASAGALVACSEEVELPNGTKVGGVREVTFSANGGMYSETSALTLVKTDAKGHIATEPAKPTYEGHRFTGYNFKMDGTGEKITFGENGTVFAIDVTVYAQWEKETKPEPPPGPPGPGPDVETEYKVTFHGGDHGSIVGETTTKTVNGKISGFPDVDADAGWLLDNDGWTLEDGETLVGLDFDFNEDTHVYAHYVVDPVTEAAAVAVINGKNTVMTDNTESISAVAKEHGQDLEYIIQGLTLTQGATIAFQVRNEAGVLTPLEFYLEGDSRGVDISVTDTEISSATTLNDGTFQIVLKHNTKDIDGSDKLSWSVSINDGSPAPVFDDGLYVVGKMTAWQLNNDYMISDGSLEILLPAGQPFKLGKCIDGVLDFGDAMQDAGVKQYSWYQLDDASKAKSYIENTGAPDNNVTLTQEGTYIITVTGTTWSITLKGEGPVIDPERPTVDPEPPARAHTAATVNDEAMTDVTATVDRNWNAQYEVYNNHTLADQFKATLNVTAETVYTFKADGTAINVYVQCATGIQAKVGGAFAPGTGANVTLVAGDYDVYLKYFSDSGNWTIWIEGTQTGTFNGDEPGPTPTAPDREYENAVVKVGEVTMTDATADVERGTAENPQNQTLSDQFMGALAPSAETTYAFKVDGEALTGVIIENADTIEVRSTAAGFTLAAGNYTVYLKHFNDTGAWVAWIQGTQTGEFGTTVTTKANGIYIGEEKVAALVVNTGNTNTGCIEYWFGGDTVKFTKNSKLTIYIEGEQLENIYSPQGVTGDNTVANGPHKELTVPSTGNYSVFLKKWKDTGNYTVEFAKDADVNTTDELKGTKMVLTGSDGKSITLYLADASGNGVTLSEYKLWVWGTPSGNLYGTTDSDSGWSKRPTVEAEMTASKALGDKISFKLTNGSNESINLENVSTGKTYVITIGAIGANFQLTIQEYVG